MGRLKIAPFSDEHLDAAAALLAARHARHRAAMPLLSDRWAVPERAREALGTAWHAEGASGAVALREGDVSGFLVGAPRAAPIWGANVWIETAGHAAESAETVRDLYAFAAARWVEEGRTRHYALVPATDADLVDAWFRLSFGVQQAHGAREVLPATEVHIPDGFELRAPRPDEVETLIEVELALPDHQRRSPVFASIPLPDRDAMRAEWLSTMAAGEEELLVAFAGDRAAACWSLMALEDSPQHRQLLRSENAGFLGFAATLPEFRGSGLGTSLTDACLARAADRGYDVIVTDWRMTNLLASRFWPQRGFRETFLRLYRSIP